MVDEPEKQRTWIPAREALALVLPVYDDVASNAERALMEWAAMDQVVTRCAAHVRTWESGGRDLLSDDYRGPEFWDPILTPQSNRDWRAGNFSVGHYDSLGGSWTVRATGVLFCKDDLLALLPTAPETWLTARAALALLAHTIETTMTPRPPSSTERRSGELWLDVRPDKQTPPQSIPVMAERLPGRSIRKVIIASAQSFGRRSRTQRAEPKPIGLLETSKRRP